MGFIESIFGEINHLVIDGIGRLFINSVGDAARNALASLPYTKFWRSFSMTAPFSWTWHGAPGRFVPGVSGQITHDLHNLLLVDDTAIGRLKDRLQLRAVR